MIWNRASKVCVFCILIIITFTGCFAGLNQRSTYRTVRHVDLSSSTSDEVATIKGGYRTMLGLVEQFCWIYHPANATRVTVNAGMIDIVAMCKEQDNVTNTSFTDQATFHFDAQAGHEYEISPKCDGCIRLLDVTANEVIAISHY